MNITKSGIILSNNIIEEIQYNKQGSIYKEINPNLLPGIVDIKTTKDSTEHSIITIGSISGDAMKALAGKTLCCTYEVSANGERYSTEQGESSWTQTRYGIHCTLSIDNNTCYPFADYLNYSGPATRVIMTFTVPSGTNFSQLGVAVQNFDKPASTNNEIWYIKNLKIEIGDHPTPFVMSDFLINGDAISVKEVIEI